MMTPAALTHVEAVVLDLEAQAREHAGQAQEKREAADVLRKVYGLTTLGASTPAPVALSAPASKPAPSPRLRVGHVPAALAPPLRAPRPDDTPSTAAAPDRQGISVGRPTARERLVMSEGLLAALAHAPRKIRQLHVELGGRWSKNVLKQQLKRLEAEGLVRREKQSYFRVGAAAPPTPTSRVPIANRQPEPAAVLCRAIDAIFANGARFLPRDLLIRLRPTHSALEFDQLVIALKGFAAGGLVTVTGSGYTAEYSKAAKPIWKDAK